MEDSWRYRPIQGNNNICPSCSTSHYPFCSRNQPPLPLGRNGHVPPIHQHHHHQRPYFDPYRDSNSRVIPPPPSYANLNDVSWNSSSHVRKYPEPLRNSSVGVNGFTSSYDYGDSGELFDSDRMNKRIKVDNNMNPGSIGPAPPVIGDCNLNVNGVYTDDERRLSLVRQHGRNTSVHPGGLGGGEARGSDWVPRPPSNNGATNFHDTGFGSVDQQQHMRSETNGFHPGFTSVDHWSDNHLKPPSAQSYGASVFQTSAPNYNPSTQQGQDFAVVHEEKGFQHMNQREVYYQNKQHVDIIQQPNVSYGASYSGTQASQGEFRANSYSPLQSKDSEPTKGFRSNLTSWQTSLASYLPNQDLHYHGHTRDLRHSIEVKPLHLEGIQRPHNMPIADKFGAPNSWEQAPQTFGVQPPLPPGPPPPLPVDPPGPPLLHMQATTSPNMMPCLYPIPVGSFDSPHSLLSSVYETQSFPSKHPSPDKPNRIDASFLLRQPHRATRPDHIVIILRGLPGSGKSYLAKMLRDLEVENGGGAPRIHSMDDYFMTEVEKVDEREGSNTGSAKGRTKTVTKKVMEYCYEPEMEEAYRASMLKAFRKTLEDGSKKFIIVDDCNLRVADFAQFWATAKRTGYEVYLLEAAYKDPLGCTARNVHGFTSDDIQKMAILWEEAPPLYLQLDTQSLIRGDGPNASRIQEVDMDMEEDVACDEGSAKLQDPGSLKTMEPLVKDDAPDGLLNDGQRWHDEGNDDSIGVKELGRSKWSLDEDEYTERPRGPKGKLNAPSELLKAYSMKKKSVHWGDQVGKTGFSIGTAKKSSMKSLVIGPGAGYNLKSNPVSEEVKSGNESSWGTNSSVFQEHIRAERESFRAAFDRRRHNIQGLDTEDEY
ncbi:hypothetical protein MKX01_040261 [Papaver californicum]|nr:hypothetical protein MKX01_040261 [Papaver californicum]